MKRKMKSNKRKRDLVIICLLFVFLCTSCALDEELPEPVKEPVEPQEEQSESEEEQSEEEAVFSLDFSPIIDTTQVMVPYEKVDTVAKVSPYDVPQDLSNIVNLEQFGEFTSEQKHLLVQNGFVVTPSNEEQLFYIYEKNEYLKIPSFVTTDSVLQVYHIFYDYSLRVLEKEKLLGHLEELTHSMMDKSIIVYDMLEDPDVKIAQMKNMAYFGVAMRCLGKDIPNDLPKEAVEIIESEFEKIEAMQGFEPSILFPFDLDYSQYKPRGHYTRSDDFKRYFKTMMWYGQAPFSLYYLNEQNLPIRNVEGTLQAQLICCMVSIQNGDYTDILLWEKIYSPTVFYVGTADDLSILEYREILQILYGDQINFDDLNDEQNMNLFYEEADKLPEPRIQAKYTGVTTPVGKQFRFMGQRYVPDAYIIQELVEPYIRPIPSGLDVMGTIGSERAYQIMVEDYKVLEDYPGYEAKHDELKAEFTSLGDDTWRSNMYYGWMWTLQGLLGEYETGYPSFMTNQAWTDKSLATALGSWSELKHDTVLYGKQSGAECGGGEEPPQIKGYVEPSVEVYNRLLWLTRYSRANLTGRDLLIPELENKMERFEELLGFLIECSEKELKGQELSEEDYYQLMIYGGTLEYMTSSFAGDVSRWFEITSETDKNMAVIADIHTIAPNIFNPGGYFEVGVGTAQEIFVVVPIGDALYLTRGATFSYYEFDSVVRLTDEDWQEALADGMAPPQPEWMRSFQSKGKDEIPEPVNPYSTGC